MSILSVTALPVFVIFALLMTRNGLVLRRGIALFAVGAVLLTLLGLATEDGEGKLLGTMLGSIGVCFIAPFLIVCRDRMPAWASWLLAAALVVGSLYANCYACLMAGTIYTHPGDHLFLLVFCGIGAMIAGAVRFFGK